MTNKISRLAVCLIGVALAGQSLGLARSEEPEVLIASDVLVGDDEVTRPTKETPIWYYLYGGSERSLGQSVAGERMPPQSEFEQQLTDMLAKQGFVRSEMGGAMPSIIIVYSFGSANLDIMEWSDSSMDAEGNETTSTDGIILNHREMATLTGASKARFEQLNSDQIDAINEAMAEDRLYVQLAAFDAEALKTKKKRMLWRTSMTISSRRNSLSTAFPAMLASAAPYFGADIKTPAVITEDDRRNTSVDLGDLEVIENDVSDSDEKSPR